MLQLSQKQQLTGTDRQVAYAGKFLGKFLSKAQNYDPSRARAVGVGGGWTLKNPTVAEAEGYFSWLLGAKTEAKFWIEFFRPGFADTTTSDEDSWLEGEALWQCWNEYRKNPTPEQVTPELEPVENFRTHTRNHKTRVFHLPTDEFLTETAVKGVWLWKKTGQYFFAEPFEAVPCDRDGNPLLEESTAVEEEDATQLPIPEQVRLADETPAHKRFKVKNYIDEEGNQHSIPQAEQAECWVSENGQWLYVSEHDKPLQRVAWKETGSLVDEYGDIILTWYDDTLNLVII